MVDTEKVNSLIEWKKSLEPHIPWAHLYFDDTCLKFLGEDPEAVVEFIRGLDVEAITELYEIECEIQEKYQTTEIEEVIQWMAEQLQ